MSIEKDLLIGKIAMKAGYLSRDELDRALEIQDDASTQDNPPSLGEILVDEGYITEDQLNDVVEHQQQRFEESPSYSELRKKQVLFGKLAVRYGYCSEEELNEALRRQGKLVKEGERKRLGQILVDQGTISREEAREILRKQSKKLMICDSCEKKLNVARFVKGEQYLCPACNEKLRPAEEETLDVEETLFGIDLQTGLNEEFEEK